MQDLKQYEKLIWQTAIRFHRRSFVTVTLEDMIQELWVALYNNHTATRPPSYDEAKEIIEKRARQIKKKDYQEQRDRKALERVYRNEYRQNSSKYNPQLLAMLKEVNDQKKWDKIMGCWQEYFDKLSIEDQKLIDMYKVKHTQTMMARYFSITRQGIKKRLRRIMDGFQIYYKTKMEGFKIYHETR